MKILSNYCTKNDSFVKFCTKMGENYTKIRKIVLKMVKMNKFFTKNCIDFVFDVVFRFIFERGSVLKMRTKTTSSSVL